MKNFHVPLPDQTYALLRAEAGRTQVSATTLAREAIDLWLNYQARKARHNAMKTAAMLRIMIVSFPGPGRSI